MVESSGPLILRTEEERRLWIVGLLDQVALACEETAAELRRPV